MYLNIKKFHILTAFLGILAVLNFSACQLENLNDPNNPSAPVIEGNATLGEIQNVADGIQAGMRNNLPIYIDGVGVIGREFYRFSGSDPRYTNDLLGGDNAVLDPGGFYTTNSYGSRYRVIRNCYILENAIDNTTETISDADKRAAKGFCKTIRAHELLLALNQQWSNGIRVDVSDPDNLGAFQTKDESLRAIIELLDDANTDLNAGGAFPFVLRNGFTGFNTPAGFSKFNRALAARVNAYHQQWDQCISALNASFLDASPTGDLKAGCYYTYSQSGGDLLNELFQSSTATGEIRIVQPSFVTDAEPGDTRLSKAFLRADAPAQAGLSGSYGFNVYPTNTTSIPIIRNEELILLWAEAKIQKGDAGSILEALGALNRIRSAAGLLPYAGGVTQQELLNEMLKQRRYSLYGEGHRWVDMRRYNRLGDLPKDRPGDDVWESFPRPTNE